jgi:hypothetical protein
MIEIDLLTTHADRAYPVLASLSRVHDIQRIPSASSRINACWTSGRIT